MKKEPAAKSITVYTTTTTDNNSIFSYFNAHDLFPVCSEQLDRELENIGLPAKMIHSEREQGSLVYSITKQRGCMAFDITLTRNKTV